MARRFRSAGGKVGIWEGHTDTDPFDAPLSHLANGRLKFHSDIPYVKIVAVKDFTLNVPAITGATPARSVSYTLGTHGQPGQPFIAGRIIVNSVPVAFTGSVPVHQGGGAFSSGDEFARWLALGADATNVYVHEYAVQHGNANTGVYNGRPVQTFAIRCYITDLLL